MQRPGLHLLRNLAGGNQYMSSYPQLTIFFHCILGPLRDHIWADRPLDAITMVGMEICVPSMLSLSIEYSVEEKAM